MSREDTWEEVARVFGLVMDAAPEERSSILDDACGDDDVLRAEVESLLEADGGGDDVLGKLGAAVAELAPGVAHELSTSLAEVGLSPGEQIDGRYVVRDVLGRGGMGVVIAAEHADLGEAVAIKVLRPEAVESERARRRFVREARAAARIQSPHVVRPRDVGTLPNGAPYLVMDRLEGVDLAAVLAQRAPLPVAEACLIALQVCEALATAHHGGIVHRDIKPANLFLERAPHGELSVKLLDFGISKVVEAQDGDVLTGTSDLVGSPAYMSPEQLRASRDVDPRADLWSLGVVLYEMLSGDRPFRADSVADVSMMILVEPAPTLPKELPPALVGIVDRCLAKRREERYGSVAELAAALAPFGGEEGHRRRHRIQAIMGETMVREPAFIDLADTVAASPPTSATQPPARAEEAPSRLPWLVVPMVIFIVVVVALPRDEPASTTPAAPSTPPPPSASQATSEPPIASAASSTTAPTTTTASPRPDTSARPPAPATRSSAAPRAAPTVDPYATRP